jgi:ATP-dependent Lon protease
VLPVGGINKKAAARAGLATVILPARKRKDYEEIPEATRNALRFLWAERVEDVIEAALDPASEPSPAAAAWRPPVNAPIF